MKIIRKLESKILGEKFALLSDGSVQFEGRDLCGRQIKYDINEMRILKTKMDHEKVRIHLIKSVFNGYVVQ